MLFWLIILLAIGLTIICARSRFFDTGEWRHLTALIFSAAILIFSAAIATFLFLAVVYSLVPLIFCEIAEEQFKTVPIVSASLDNNTSGNFSLGGGSIRSVEYYFFYEKVGEGKYKRGKLRASKCMIQEMTTEIKGEPRIEWTSFSWKNPKWLGGPCPISDTVSEHIIIVPKGTVIEQYNLQ